MHEQIERLQQTNFPEFITINSQATVPSTNSLAATCIKHSLQAFVSLGSECQAGIYCPECAELCPLSVNTIIHRCQNCAESYCLLCMHEYGYCLACEIEPEAQSDEPLQSFHVPPDQPSSKPSDVSPPVTTQLTPQFKALFPPFTQKCIRR